MYTVAGGKSAGPYFFLGWARPESYKLQARKRPSLTGPGFWDIIRFKKEK